MRRGRPVVIDFTGCVREIFKNYKRNCARRKIDFEIPFDLFEKLLASNCVYCGRAPRNTLARTYVTFIYQGIDRKDNGLGYTAKNVVACCKVCNSIKGEHLSHAEMIFVAQALNALRQGRLVRRR